MDKVIENWDKILQTVKADYDVGDVAFNTWLKPLKVYDVKDNVITILVPSEQVVLINLLNKKYKLLLQVTICEITGMDECEVKFISPDEAPKKEVSSYTNAAAETGLTDIDRRCEEAHLNPKYIFDTFIVGNNNKFAQAAALAVAESPGVRWPNGIKPGKQQAPFSMIDVYASFAALLNHELPTGVAPDSRDQLNNFLGTDTIGCDYVVQQNLNNTLSIIQNNWKYIEP